MSDNLFDTPEKIELAIANFTTLMQHPGWLLLEEIVNANIDLLTEQILAGGDEKLMNEKRLDLKAHKNVINTPRDQIRALKTDESPENDPDPYDQPKPLESYEKSKA